MHSLVRANRLPRSLSIAALALALLATIFFVAARPDSVAAQPGGATCYSVADLGGNNEGATDDLLSITGGAVTVVGQMGTNDAEAFAIRPGDTAYAWSGADGLGLVTVDLGTGATAAAPFAVPGPKVEGLTWANTADNDLTNDILYVVRTNGTVEGYTPAGAAAGISANIASAGFPEGTDIAWDPVDDLLYAIRTDDSVNGDMTQVVSINGAGAVSLVGASALDLEGLGFTDDGTMLGTTGDDGGDDLYVVSQGDGSVGASLADLSGNIDNEDVDCRSLELPADPGVLSAVITDECVNNAGKITATISYDSGADAANYSVAISGQATQTGTINAGDAPVMVMSPADLVDGAYTVVVTNTSSGAELASQTVTIACAADPGVLTTAIADECVNDDGKITVTVSYQSGSDPVDYSVTVQGQAAQIGTLNPGDAPAMVMFSPLADGSYAVVVNDTTNNTQIGSATVTITCDPTEPPSASAAVECVDGLGKVTVTMFNPTGSVVDYVTTVAGVQETESLNPRPTVVSGDILINEFMADNETSLVDGNGANVDWIELYNPTGASIDISGWTITDDAADIAKQVIPATTIINAGGYLYLFQGDGNLAASGPTFNFGLGSGGEYLGLYDDQGALVSEYAAEYPDQFTDVSYGIGSDGSVGYFNVPSIPGNSANGVPTSTVPMAMDMIDSLPDGITDVIVTANGSQIVVANSPVTIACDTGEVTVAVAPACAGEDGRIVTTVTNTTQQAAAVVVSYSAGGGPDQTATVAAGATQTITRTARADGSYTVTVTVDGAAAATETVTVECDPDIVEMPALTLELNVNTADADAAPGPTINEGGAVSYTYIVTNSGDVPLTNVTVTDDSGLAIDCVNGSATIASMAVGAVVTCTASTTAVAGLVTTTASASGTSPANATVSASDPANYTGQVVPAGEITFTFDNRCVGGNGGFYFVVTNTTPNAATAVLTVTGLADKTVTVPAGATVLVARTGRPDNTYDVQLIIDGTPVSTTTEVVDCDEDPPPAAGEIGDRVFNDVNRNGIQDANEIGISGVTVNLWTDDDGNGTPDAQVGTTTTAGDGTYKFTGLDTSKTYVVQFIPGGRSISPANVGGSDAVDSDPNAQGITGPITLNPGEFDNTVDAGLFDSGEVISTFFNECVAGNGSLYLLVTNNTLSAIPVVLDVTGLPTKTATVAPGATSFVGRTGRPDGTYQVTAVVNGTTVVDSAEVVACDAPPPPPEVNEGIGLALALVDGPTANADGNYDLKYTYTARNTGPQPVTITSIDNGLAAAYAGATIITQNTTMDLCTGSTLAVAASCTVMILVTVDVNDQPGPFLTSATVNGVAQDGDPVTDVSTNGTNVDPTGNGPGDDSVPTPASFPGSVAFVLNNTCLAGNGAFIYKITNDTTEPITVTLTVGNIAHGPKTVVVQPGTMANVGITGRADGTYPVTLEIDGAVVDMADRVVLCDAELGRGTALVSEPTCMGAAETVIVTLEHLSGVTDVSFVIGIDGTDLAPVVLSPGDPIAVVTLDPLAAGDHTITVSGDNVESVTKTVTIGALPCARVVSVEGQCIDVTEGFIRVTFDNPTTEAVVFTVQTTDGVTTDIVTGTVPAGALGARLDQTAFPEDGMYDMIITASGVEAFNGMVAIACGTPQLMADISFDKCELDGRGNVAIKVTYVDGDRVATYDYAWDNGAPQIGSRSGTISQGMGTNFVRLLFDGVVTITVTDTTDGRNEVIATEDIVIQCTDPVLTAQAAFVDCVAGRGSIAVDLAHVFGAQTADYEITWANAVQSGSALGTLAPAATTTQTITGLLGGDTTVTVTNVTGGRTDVVGELVVTIPCEAPELASAVTFGQCTNGAGDVNIEITYVGGDGQATYEILWDNGVQTGSIGGAISQGSIVRTITGLIDGQTAFTIRDTTGGAPVDIDTEVITITCP